MIEESAELHGWNTDFTLKWEAVAYPEYVYNLLQQSSPVEDDDNEEGNEDDEGDEEFAD